jgi:hypothetical protein
MNIYDILKSITYLKDADMINDPEFEKVYSQFSINAFLCAHPNTVHLAMFASGAKLTNAQHYLFLLYTTDKEYIYFKREYTKKDNSKTALEIDAISDYYNINEQHARDIHVLLNETQINNIFEIFNTKDVIHDKKITRI